MDADRIKLLHDGDPVHELQAKYAESKLRITDLETQLAESRERERKDLGGNREGGEVMDEKACCAHLHVKYNPVELKPGSFIDRWTCSECEMCFVPGPALTAVSSELTESQERERENDADYRRIHIALFGSSPSQGDATASGIVFGIERLQAKIRKMFSGVSIRRSVDYVIAEVRLYDGSWRELIKEHLDSNFSHAAYPSALPPAQASAEEKE